VPVAVEICQSDFLGAVVALEFDADETARAFFSRD